MALKSKIRHRISRSQGKTRKKTRVRSQDKSMTRLQPLKLQLYDQLLLLLLPECLNTAVSLSHFGEWWNGSTCKLAVSNLSVQPGKELAARGQGKRRWRRRRRQRMMLQLTTSRQVATAVSVRFMIFAQCEAAAAEEAAIAATAVSQPQSGYFGGNKSFLVGLNFQR